MLIDRLINNLPLELKNLIITFSYKVQPSQLLLDIISYYDTKKLIYKLFFIKFNNFLVNKNNTYLNYLNYNLHCFLLGINTYSDNNKDLVKFYNKNYIYLNNINSTISKIINLSYPILHPKLRFGIIWGLLDFEERNKFIHYNNNLYV